MGYTNRYLLTTQRYPGVHSFQSRKTIVKVGLKTPEGVRRPSSAWLTGIIVTLLMLLDMDVKSLGLLPTRSPLICCCGLRRAILYCGEHRSCSGAMRTVVWTSPAAWNGKVVCFRLQRCGERAVAVYVKVRVQTFRKRLHGDFAYIGKVLDIGMWASLFVVRRRSASDQGLSPWSVSSHQNCR